jgi:hypothetical protein
MNPLDLSFTGGAGGLAQGGTATGGNALTGTFLVGNGTASTSPNLTASSSPAAGSNLTTYIALGIAGLLAVLLIVRLTK